MKEEKLKKGKKYLIIGILVLFLSIIGVSVSYYLARVQGTLSGRASGTELELTITKLSTSASMDLIPLDNDLETLNLASLGYGNNSEEFDATKACIDINGYSVCQIYRVRVTNNGTVPVKINGTVELYGANTPNIDCAKMDDEVTVTNNASCTGVNNLASNVTLPANNHLDYYIMVYINNLDESQYDSGTFNGTVTFVSTDGRKVKGRFVHAETLAEYITNLYTNANKTTVTHSTSIPDGSPSRASNTNKKAKSMLLTSHQTPGTPVTIDYHYATSVGLMNDRLGGTTTSLDGGNIRYYGATPNNYIDIGDKTVVDVTKGNWEALLPQASTAEECLSEVGSMSDEDMITATGYETAGQFCSFTTIPAGTPILWRIIGVFDGKLRIRRDESIGVYSFDTSPSNVNNGGGINEWSQADLMKLLNPGYENNLDKNYAGEDVTVNNSLYWTSGSGNCYGWDWDQENDHWDALACDFTNTGLSDEAKEYVVDQTVYLGGFNTSSVFANEAYQKERGNDVYYTGRPDSWGDDTITRTLSWTGKVGLIYPSDFGYAADFSDSNCQGDLRTLRLSGCSANWMNTGFSWTVSPWVGYAATEMLVSMGDFFGGPAGETSGGWPVLTLSPEVIKVSGTGTSSDPYKIDY